MTIDYTVKADPRESFIIELVGERYTIKAPKAALALKLAVRAKQAETSGDYEGLLSTVNEWTVQAFGVEGAQSIDARFEDPDDDLDLPHLMKLMELVMEKTTGNPTT